MRTILVCALALLAAPAVSAESWTATCAYWSLDGASYDGPCTITSSTAADGAYVATVAAGTLTLTLTETARQGVWSTYQIDGKPGVRFEHNRTSYSYSTLALDMTLDVQTGE